MQGGLPIIDMAALFGADADARLVVAEQIAAACEGHGFFYLIGHQISAETLSDLETASARFFALPQAQKLQIAMARGGRAWRGFFPVGGELTSGKPDLKEGLYLGTELGPDHPRVRAGMPLHGVNLWPAEVPQLRPAVERYMAGATRAAAALMEGVSLSLGLDGDYFERTYTANPTVLFRIFHYPASEATDTWGVGEHTDYGLLTLLAQDRQGGLQVHGPGGWIEAPPIPGALVCNIGDMLERLTGGRYVSTPHRVANRSGHGRLSFPLFFDPDFEAQMGPLPGIVADPSRLETDARSRWDAASVHAFEGRYGDYLLAKVGKVFPDLQAAAMPD